VFAARDPDPTPSRLCAAYQIDKARTERQGGFSMGVRDVIAHSHLFCLPAGWGDGKPHEGHFMNSEHSQLGHG